MDRIFICPACGHQTAYDPTDCWAGVRFRREGERVVKDAYRFVRCPG
jgi:hypothetical protein